jgi:hypothetical protein
LYFETGRERDTQAGLHRSLFGGTIAPVLKIELDGNRSHMLGLA